MDNAFLLDDSDRANFLQATLNSFGCTYICLWSHITQPFNCLLFLDGYYHEEENSQPSTSSGSVAQSLFYDYRQSVINVDDDLIPGLAFKNKFSFLEVHESDLHTKASVDVQRKFYMAARIKTSFFFGSIHGEIELGFSSISQVNKAMEMIKVLFPDEFSRQVIPPAEPFQSITAQHPLSSSSSSLRSHSMSSPDCSSFTFNIPTTSFQTLQAFPALPSSSSSPPLLPFPHHSTRNLPGKSLVDPRDSAFRKYSCSLSSAMAMRQSLSRQSMLKRSISFFKYLNFARISDQRTQPSRPTSMQMNHMISERKRREKLNESFQALRSVLPTGTKRDKTSVLAATRDYLTSLKAQVDELRRKNQILEAQILPKPDQKEETASSSLNERFSIRISHVPESTRSSSTSRIIDLQVVVEEAPPMADMAVSIVEFLKQINNVNVVSMEASTCNFNFFKARLIIEGCEWDEAVFEEAIRRLIVDQLIKY